MYDFILKFASQLFSMVVFTLWYGFHNIKTINIKMENIEKYVLSLLETSDGCTLDCTASSTTVVRFLSVNYKDCDCYI